MSRRGNSKAIVASLAGALCAVTLTSPGHAQGPDLSWPPSFYQEGTAGFLIEDTWLLQSRLNVVGPNGSIECDSLDDRRCAKIAEQNGWWIERVAPPCDTALAWEECIESLALVSTQGSARSLEFTGLAPGATFNADPGRGLPTGSAISLFDDPDSDDPNVGYAAYLGGEMNGRDGPFHLAELAMQVIRYQLVSFDSKTSSGPCLWATRTRCAERLPFPEDTAIRLSVRLHESMSGWLGGRLDEPVLSVDPLKGELNRVVVTAKPVEVPLIHLAIPVEDVTPEILEFWAGETDCGGEPCPITVIGMESSGTAPPAFMHIYRDFLGDTATRAIPTWSVVNMHNPRMSPCLTSTERLLGLVTTNATIYSANPPVFAKGALTYKVAGLHYLPSGDIFRGSYDLVLRSDTARCLYGFSNAPVRAEIEVTSDDGVDQVVTTSLSERDGWLRLSARGFTFSQPTIRVKLTSESAERSIMCKKGKKTKKVTGANPKCPRGWKQVPFVP